MALEPLTILYRGLVPILNAFAIQYRIEIMAPSVHQVQSRTVEESIRMIVKAEIMRKRHRKEQSNERASRQGALNALFS